MTEAEVVRIMREHLEGQFPKVCNTCKRRYATLREDPLNTQTVGPASYDAEVGDWNLCPLGPPLSQLPLRQHIGVMRACISSALFIAAPHEMKPSPRDC